MAHLTAGDIKPLAGKDETSYGVPSGTAYYYADLAGQNGSFTPMDSVTPYIAWRSGDRSYSYGDHTPQQVIAGYKAVLEVRDLANWNRILGGALGTNNGTTALGSLPSKTVQVGTAGGAGSTITYYGCKTDELTIKMDTPGGVITFEETVMAKRVDYGTVAAFNPTLGNTYHALQQHGAFTINSVEVYPQRFAIKVRNNLERVIGWDTTLGEANTVALAEGRREIELELELWREDITRMEAAFNATKVPSAAVRVGYNLSKSISLNNLAYIPESVSPILQDKQTEVVRFRATEITSM